MNEESLNEIIDGENSRSYNIKYIDFIDNIRQCGGDLASFWISFLEVSQILLNIIYATRSGDWELLLETLKDVVPYTFSYNTVNYSRYLSSILGEMMQLEHTHPDVYRAFSAGHFSVQLTEGNSFGRIEPDKCIEMTINKDTKTPDGTTGFSTSPNAIIRWSINATYRAELRKKMHEFASYRKQEFLHKDLKPSRRSQKMKKMSDH